MVTTYRVETWKAGVNLDGVRLITSWGLDNIAKYGYRMSGWENADNFDLVHDLSRLHAKNVHNLFPEIKSAYVFTVDNGIHYEVEK